MKKRIKLILLLLVLFHWSVDLRAETRLEDCQALDRYVTEAKTNFAGLRGREVDEYTVEANMFLPDASNCEIRRYLGDDWDAVCTFLFIDEKDQEAGLREIERTIAQCAGYAPNNYQMQIANEGYRGQKKVNIYARRKGRFDDEILIERDRL